MPYIDLAGLSRFASRQKDRLERDYALLRDMQWLRTDKAGAVSLWPAGGTPLKPVVDFLFAETPPASGDKGPDNPSTISGVSSVTVTRCGKNLIPFPDQAVSEETNGVIFTVNQDGSILVNGTASADASYVFFRGTSSDRPKHIYYHSNAFTVSGCPSGGSDGTYWVGIQCRNTKGTVVVNGKDFGSGYSFSGTYGAYISYCGITIKSGYTANNLLFKPQIEFGSDITEFEKGISNPYVFSLGNTYYGGTLDVASGVMAVTYKYISNVIGGTTSLGIDGDYAKCLIQTGEAVKNDNTSLVCNRFLSGGSSGERVSCRGTDTFWSVNCVILKSRLDFSSVADPSNPTNAEIAEAFSSWLASNPTSLVFARTTPQTVQLDPVSISALAQTDKYTPRLNTVYTDASAVQVGYVKSPIRDEYELQQAVIAQGGNV